MAVHNRLHRALRCSLILCLIVFGTLAATAQNPPASCESQPPQTSPQQSPATSNASLAAAARDAKNQKTTHAKKVFTDEDMEVTTGPLPRLKMEGPENADEVVAAISAYKASHTPEQTERAVHIWYERYDEILAAAIEENLQTRVLRDANSSNGYELCQESQDYRQCQNRQMAEQRGARSDQVQMMKNNNLEVRIQHAFTKVRNGLMMNNLRYEWFKVRTTNGIDTF